MAQEGNAGTAGAGAEKTYTQADLERERAYAQNYQQQLTEANNKLKAFDGVDVETLRQKAARAEELENKAALGDPKKLEERILAAKTEAEAEANKRYGSKLEELEGLSKTQARELHTLRVTNAALAEAAKVGFAADGMKFLQREVDARCEFQDGKIIVKGDDGKPLYSKANPRELMTLNEWLIDFGAENPCLMDRQTTKGTADGNRPKQGAGLGTVRFPDFGKMSPADAAKWFKENPEGAKAFAENGYRTN